MARSAALAAFVVSVIIAVAMVLLTVPAPLSVTNVRAFPVTGSTSAMVTLDIRNEGRADRLVDARAAGTKLTVLKSPVSTGLPIPAKSEVSLAMEAGHIMLMSVEAPLVPGASLPIDLEFAKGGVQTVKAMVSDGMVMDHGAVLDVAREDAPTVEIAVMPDSAGWTVTLQTGGFEFARDLVDGPHVPGKGHAHLYVSGTKIGRLYAPQGRIGALPPGDYIVEVTLNTNDHRAYGVDGMPITASAPIRVD